jgi:hypothetical protein
VQTPVLSTATDSGSETSQYVEEEMFQYVEDSADIPSLEAPEDLLLTDNGIDDVSDHSTPFPKVPEGFPYKSIWTRPEEHDALSLEERERLEALDKALIALWNRGDHGFTGGSVDNNTKRIYPHYPNTIYVRWKEKTDENGKVVRFITRVSGGPDIGRYFSSLSQKQYSEMLRSGNFPSHIRVLDRDTEGYDLYDLLSDFE